ncbi:MAG: hypothetical protein Q9163_006506 [Psora crenata]
MFTVLILKSTVISLRKSITRLLPLTSAARSQLWRSSSKPPGNIHELQGDPDGALHAYEQALRHNSYSVQALNAISGILRTKENFPRAVEYLQLILKIDGNNGEVWGSLGTHLRAHTDPSPPQWTDPGDKLQGTAS